MIRTVKKKFDVAVIGGGLGLSAAITAAKKVQVILVGAALLESAAASGLGILGYLDSHGRNL